jgi:hypothetical protein
MSRWRAFASAGRGGRSEPRGSRSAASSSAARVEHCRGLPGSGGEHARRRRRPSRRRGSGRPWRAPTQPPRRRTDTHPHLGCHRVGGGGDAVRGTVTLTDPIDNGLTRARKSRSSDRKLAKATGHSSARSEQVRGRRRHRVRVRRHSWNSVPPHRQPPSVGCATSVTWQVGETMTPGGRLRCGLLPSQLASPPGASVAEAAVGRLDSVGASHSQQILSAANNFAKAGIFSVR